MANDLTGRQWKIDTPGTTLLWRGNAKILDIEFTDYTVDTSSFIVTDNADRVVWSGNGNADLSPVRSGRVGWVDGIKVPTLSAGKLLIHLV